MVESTTISLHTRPGQASSRTSGASPILAAALSHPSYRPDIDGLRAVAVLSVVGYHAFPANLRGGFVGVDVFFVISGYLISTILMGSLAAGRFSLIDFYRRRIRRIFPALLLVVGATFAVGWFALLADQYGPLGKHVAAGAGFVSNLVSWNESGYFDTAADAKPLLHLWSLGIEEQFYIVWPLILWAAWRLRTNVLVWTLAMVAGSFAWNAWLVRTDAVADFYSPLSRFWELGCGAALAGLTIRYNIANRAPSGATHLQSCIGAGLLGTGFLTITAASPFPGWWALLPTLGAVTLIAAGPGAWINRYVLASRPLVWVGLISYPLYLWHWPILSFIRILDAERPSRVVRLVAIGVAILLAWGTYRWIERPVRSGVGKRSTTVALAGALLAMGIAGYACFATGGFPFRASATAPVLNAGDVGHAAFYRYSADHFTPCEAVDIRAGAEAWENIPRCFQSRPGAVDVAIVGDSHAEHLFIGLAEALPQANVVFYLKSSVPVAANPAYQSIFRTVLADPHIRTVVLSAWWTLRFGELQAGVTPEAALRATVEPLLAAGKMVWLADDVPNFSFDPRLCKYAATLLRTYKCSDPADFYGKQLAGYASLFADFARGDPRLKILDLAKHFCDGTTCTMARDGRLLYRDSDHLNVTGSQELGRRLVADHPDLGGHRQ